MWWFRVALVLVGCAALGGCGSGDDRAGCDEGDDCGPATEICDDGSDDDGDGDADCADADCASVCPEDCLATGDDDGDLLADCADPDCATTCDGDGDGVTGPQVGGADCDDAEPAAFPGNPEIWYDGVDNDCDPATVDDDQDGDGYPIDADCDDASAATWPGAPEVCGDGVLNDCDATGAPPRAYCFGERPLATADHHLDGAQIDEASGFSVASSKDTTGDGTAEVLIGAYTHDSPAVGDAPPVEDRGAAYMVEAPFARETDLSGVACVMEGVSSLDWAGFSVAAVGDLDLDGLPNFVVGSKFEDTPAVRGGAAYVMTQDCRTGVIGQSAFEVDGDNKWELSASIAGYGDLTGDGFEDLVLGAPGADGHGEEGAVLVFAGPIRSSLASDDAWLTSFSGEEHARAGQAVAVPGDLDGTGRADIAVGMPFADVDGQPDAGIAWILLDPEPGAFQLTDALPVERAGGGGAQLGTALASHAGDLTGDGRDDLVVSSLYGGPAGEGQVLVFDAVTGTPTVAATLTGTAAGDAFGNAVDSATDVDGDGFHDLVVGAPQDDAAGEDAGAVYVFFGPLKGDRGPVEADASLFGEAPFDFAGYSVSAGADLDADGRTDLVIGAPFHDGLLPGSGRTYVVTFAF